MFDVFVCINLPIANTTRARESKLMKPDIDCIHNCTSCPNNVGKYFGTQN